MAADQRKKRVNASSLIGCTSREQYRVKRKKLNLVPTISLEWDKKKKSVVSKRGQIGISRRHLAPFIEPDSLSHNILADVFSVPEEIFELDNLSEVLSYEVWQNYLSESERSFLLQFLPKDAAPDAVVQSLLAGDNFNFVNPFLKWGTSLYSEQVHPDHVLNKEQSLKACKNDYYSDIQKYHDDMIENVRMCKEIWASCNDPEVEFVQKILRSRNHTEKSILPSDNTLYDTEENLVATPDSCSLANSEKAYSSDNQNSKMVHGESKRKTKLHRKGFLNKIGGGSSSGQKVVTMPKKGEGLDKRDIQLVGGSKYMSYVKISKQQHDHFKSSMKHAGSSNVLGSIGTLNVQPYVRFEEEEKKKMHDYWLTLANKDILVGFTNWRNRQLQRNQLMQSLCEEMEQKIEPEEATLDQEKEGSQDQLMDVSDDSEEEIPPTITIEGVEEDSPENLLPELRDNEKEIYDDKDRMSDNICVEQSHDPEKIEDDGDVPIHDVLIQDHHKEPIASLDNGPRINAMLMEQNNPVFLQDQNFPINNPIELESHVNNHDGAKTIEEEYSGNLINHMEIPISSGSNIWPSGDVHGGYYQSTAANDGYQRFIQEQPVQIPDKDVKNILLTRQPIDDMSFFDYLNQDRNELLHSLLKGQSSSLSYHNEKKKPGLDLHHGINHHLVTGLAQFHGNLREHKRLNNDVIYMHQDENPNIYSRDWAAMNPTTTTSIASGPPPLMNSTWYSGGWASSFEGGVGKSDQSLFSVLSECNGVPNYGSGFVQPGNYNGSIHVPSSSNIMSQQYIPNPLNYSNGNSHDQGAVGKMSNHGVLDSMGQPFLRPWNQ